MTVLLVCVICGFPRPWPSCFLLWNEGGHGIFNVRNDLCGCCAHDPRRGRCRQLICRNVGRAEAQSVLQTVRSNSHQFNCWRVRHGQSFRLSGPAVERRGVAYYWRELPRVPFYELVFGNTCLSRQNYVYRDKTFLLRQNFRRD